MKLKKHLSFFSRAALTLLLMLLTTTAWAFDYTDGNGITWSCTVIESTNNVSVEPTNKSSIPAAVTIPASVTDNENVYTVTSIGNWAFYECSSLTSVTIGSNVTSIGMGAFCNCSGLTSITIGSNVTSIDEGAFYGCSSLTSINIPASVTSIGNGQFDNCTSLATITVADGNTVYDSRNNCNAIITTETNTLIFGCKNTTIPKRVTSIGIGAFSRCSGLTSINIPASVTTIAEGAFYRCSGLTAITIPNSVTTISENAFEGCSGLKTVIIGSGVTNIGDGAFLGCNNVDDVYCYADPTTLTWDGNDGYFKDGKGTHWHVADKSGWESKFGGANVTFKDDLLALTSGDCGTTGSESSVTWIYDLPSKTLTISGTGAMMDYALTSNFLHSTAPWADSYDGELEHVVVNDGVTSIGSYAFAMCGHLKSVSLPTSVFQIDQAAFYTSSLQRIDIPSTTAVTLYTNAFDYCPADLVIAVPSTLLATYKTNWSAYATKLVGVLSETDGFGTTFATGNYELKRTFKCGAASTVCLPYSVPAAQASSIGKFYTFAGIDKSGSDWAVIMEEANLVSGALTANTPYLFVPYIFTGKSQGDAVDLTISGTVSTAGNASYASWTENSTTGSYWTFQGVFYNLSWPDGHADLGKIYGFAAQSYAANGVSPGDFVKAAAGASIKPFRAFLQFTPGTSSARNVTRAAAEPLPATMTVRLVSSNGISTAIGTLDTRTGEISLDDAWFSLDGHRLSGKPSKKGLYIWNGKKVVIK